jgi:4-amino-4-deoxy-L-arabinose transferase-like glycosyltransferase
MRADTGPSCPALTSAIDLGQADSAAMESARPAAAAERVAISALVVISLVLNGWGLSAMGWGNAYYSAAVRSMGSSWHNFLFGSLDAGGFVSVDKPPFALWVQVISSKIFGYSPYALLIPEVVAGAAAVWLLYWGLRRTWGGTAGLVGAAALAVMPINVAINHSNNTDSILVLLMTGAAVAAMEAVRSGRLRWLFAASALAGCAMTTKMLAAAPVMPGILIAFAWCAPVRWRVRIRQVGAGALAMAMVGLWWFVAVQTTASNDRPYVGSTRTNSVFELAFERNGVKQVEGAPTISLGQRPRDSEAVPRPPVDIPPVVDRLPTAMEEGLPLFLRLGSRRPDRLAGLGFNSGAPAVTRLLNRQLGTQIGWLAPFAVIGALAALGATRMRRSPRLGAVLVLGCWFGAGAIVFSTTKGVVHPYYMAGIGPPLAGLVGIGASVFRFDLEAGRRRALIGAAAIGLTAWVQWTIWNRFAWRNWFMVIAAIFVAAVVGWTIWTVVAARRAHMPITRRRSIMVTAAAMAAILLAPAMWTQGSVQAGVSGPLPFAAPQPVDLSVLTGNGITPNGGLQFPSTSVPALIRYLRAHRGNERWMVAVQSAAPAEELIIPSGEPVMAVGGFVGSDPILTEQQLRQLVRDGGVRYFFMTVTAGGGIPGLFGNTAAVGWIPRLCTTIPVDVWQRGAGVNTAAPGTRAFPGGPTASTFTLYDCKGAA